MNTGFLLLLGLLREGFMVMAVFPGVEKYFIGERLTYCWVVEHTKEFVSVMKGKKKFNF